MTRDDLDLLPRETPVQLIDPAGTTVVDDGYPAPTPERLREAYRLLVIGRRINDQCNALVRQGRLAVYPSSHGQEACQVAAALVLRDGDWLFPTYRDSVAIIARGVKPADAMVLLKGDWHCGYDPYEHGVAPQSTPVATQLLHAVGFAHAAKLRGEKTVALALCGDGATSEGDFHEALNFAAVFRLPVVFLVQNNGFAISVPLSRQTAASSVAVKAIGYGMPGSRVDGNDVAALLAVLGDAVDRARAGGGPSLVEAHTYRMQAHTNADDDSRYRDAGDVQAWIDRDPLTRIRTHLTDREVLDPATEADFTAQAEDIAAALREALGSDADLDPEDLFRHVYSASTPQLDEQWGQLSAELAEGGGARMTMIDETPVAAPTETLTMAGAINRALADAMGADERVLVFGEDVGALGGVFRVTEGLRARFGEERCFDTPLAESGIVGTAVGMAMNGMRPVVEMQFDAFAYPAFEQVVSHVAKLGNRTKGAMRLPMVIRIPYGGGIGGVEHHCDSSEAYYVHTPGLTVVAPSTPQDAYSLLRAAIDSPDPVVFLEHKKLYWGKGPVDTTATVEIGRAAVVRPGTDATLIAYGSCVAVALEAAAIADAEGRSLQVIDIRSLVPFDDETVMAAVKATGRAVVIAEAPGFASVAAEIAARVAERCFEYLEAPVRRVTGFDVPFAPPKLEKYFLPDADRVLDAVDTLHWDD